MSKETPKNKRAINRIDKAISDAEFMQIMGTPVKDFNYVCHTLVALIRRVNRGDAVNDEEFAVAHQNIDLILNPYKK